MLPWISTVLTPFIFELRQDALLDNVLWMAVDCHRGEHLRSVFTLLGYMFEKSVATREFLPRRDSPTAIQPSLL